MNVTELAESLPADSFNRIWVRGDMYCVRGFRVWMNGVGKVRLVVSREDDGFHFIVSNRVDWSVRRVVSAYRRRQSVEVYIRDVKQNLGLGECQARWGRGAIIHWHLVYTAYTLLALLRCSLVSASGRLRRFLKTCGDMCRWVKKQCLRRMVDLVMAMARRRAKAETVYRMLQI
ncbi:MAG: transposase [Candidatus Bathyarchaeota archaeon]